MKSSEQHIEMGKMRRRRDQTDCQKFVNWLQERNPFTFEDEHLHSLSLGMVSEVGADDVNCENAEELGSAIHLKLDNVVLSKAKISHKDQLRSLNTLQNSARVDGKAESVNPTMLFLRLTAIAQRQEEDIEDYFSHELQQCLCPFLKEF